MALISIIQDFHPLQNTKLLERAAALAPTLYHAVCEPVSAFLPAGCGRDEKNVTALETVPSLSLKKGDSLCLDFGTHLVGYLTLDLAATGSHQDAPAFLRFRFAETLAELREDPETYSGWVSGSWIQQEQIHVDELPARLSLPRRYAFRYLMISVLDTSPKFAVTVQHAECKTETSADLSKADIPSTGDPLLDRIYTVSLRTLANCMQSVFEDGPKRDRRLWMGDFRLQALTNYVSFQNYDLVKRCLYLFGGSRFPDGRISAAVFTSPSPEADDTYLFDYALMYVAALEEYLEETGDEESLADLYDIAMEQIDYALRQCTADGLLNEQTVKDTFIDWGDELDKNACALAVLIYAMHYALQLAERKGDTSRRAELLQRRAELRDAARRSFWNEEKQLFVSNGQVSAASQVWMVLAGVPSPGQAKAVMLKTAALSCEPSMTTPYMHHFYLTALLQAGLREEALSHMKSYWGGMLDAGADTFWECWNGENPGLSPYGGIIINSCCHAWSCTPAYLIRRYLFN